MALKYVLDAHAVIWYLEGNPALGAAAKQVMDDPANDLVLPVIALAEGVVVVDKLRTALPNSDALIRDVTADPRIVIAPLTLEVLDISRRLAASIPELHDRLIVAEALVLQQAGHTVALLTKDQSIVRSGIVPIIWK
jgi:PIN domain nuclease of toxin-antitoxin system